MGILKLFSVLNQKITPAHRPNHKEKLTEIYVLVKQPSTKGSTFQLSVRVHSLSLL